MRAGLIHAGVEQVAAQQPEASAVVLDDNRLTYRDLEQRANRLARTLRAYGCVGGDRVAMLLPKTPDAIVAIIGILKAGCVYVPLDPGGPLRRIEKILASCQPRLVLTDGAGLARVRESGEGLELRRSPMGLIAGSMTHEIEADLVFGPVDLDSQPGDAVNDGTATPDSIAYILFTSGSTGTPKGVPISHSSVVAFVDWATDHFGVSPDDRLSGHSPLHFDLSVYDIFGALHRGAELHLVKPGLNLLPHRLVDFIRSHRITQWFSVPSVLAYVAAHDAVAHGDLPDLEKIHWCGEVFPTPALRYWMERLPHVTFTNLYGPTEATIASSFHHVAEIPPSDDVDIPIGRPCPGEKLAVIDGDGQVAAPGVVGKLFIGGVGLSPGYWRDADQTRSAFKADPVVPGARIYDTGDLAWVDDAGIFHFVGRVDSQIKTRGYRVELGEVESAVHRLQDVEEGAVVAIESSGFEGKLICCAYVPGRDNLTSAQLRKELAGALPGYMLPNRWQEFDVLPRNANGKIDRRLLREIFEAAEGG